MFDKNKEPAWYYEAKSIVIRITDAVINATHSGIVPSKAIVSEYEMFLLQLYFSYHPLDTDFKRFNSQQFRDWLNTPTVAGVKLEVESN